MIRKLIYAGTILWALMMFAVPAHGQSIQGFENDIREIDQSGDIVLDVRQIQGSTLAYVYVSDVWYALRCYRKRRLAKGLKAIWQRNGGSNIVVYDRAQTELADFKTFGSGFDIRGCD